MNIIKIVLFFKYELKPNLLYGTNIYLDYEVIKNGMTKGIIFYKIRVLIRFNLT